MTSFMNSPLQDMLVKCAKLGDGAIVSIDHCVEQCSIEVVDLSIHGKCAETHLLISTLLHLHHYIYIVRQSEGYYFALFNFPIIFCFMRRLGAAGVDMINPASL